MVSSSTKSNYLRGFNVTNVFYRWGYVVNFKEREFSNLKFTFSGIGTVEITGAVTTKLVNAVWVVVHRKLSGDVLTLPFRVQDHTTPLYLSHQHLEQRLQSLFQ